MRDRILIVVMFATGILVAVGEGASNGGAAVKGASLVRILPDIYTNDEMAAAQSNAANTASACIELISKAKEAFSQTAKDSIEMHDRRSAYREAWQIGVRTMAASSDKTTEQLIIDEWDRRLKEDDAAVAAQVFALTSKWDRRCLTETFWTTLKLTKNEETVAAMGCVLFQHGNRDDLNRMVKIENSVPGRGLPNAISWLRYRLSGETNTPGPAALPPRE